jgi:signal transduction histidine kinase
VTGTARPQPAAVDLAACRIIQESLTNAIRHAGPATAAVTLNYGGADLRIEVADTGGGTPADSASATGGGGGTRSAASGHGLIGMRERAASVGGVVQAGPGAGGGFCVAATLPLDGQPRPGARRDAGPDALAPVREGSRS